LGLINPGLENILNDAAETIGEGDNFVDGITHFAKKNKTDDEKVSKNDGADKYSATQYPNGTIVETKTTKPR
jgi:hypothetical protein